MNMTKDKQRQAAVTFILAQETMPCGILDTSLVGLLLVSAILAVKSSGCC